MGRPKASNITLWPGAARGTARAPDTMAPSFPVIRSSGSSPSRQYRNRDCPLTALASSQASTTMLSNRSTASKAISWKPMWQYRDTLSRWRAVR